MHRSPHITINPTPDPSFQTGSHILGVDDIHVFYVHGQALNATAVKRFATRNTCSLSLDSLLGPRVLLSDLVADVDDGLVARVAVKVCIQIF
jgi:hypothetical protein